MMTSVAAMRFARGVGATTEWAWATALMSASPLLNPVEGLHVDIGQAEDRHEENDGKGRGIAGPPALEGIALQGDRGDLGGGTRSARREQIDQVEHLEVFDAAEQHREHDEGKRHRHGDRPELAERRGAVDLRGLIDIL